jgi:hypothetical protein
MRGLRWTLGQVQSPLIPGSVFAIERPEIGVSKIAGAQLDGFLEGTLRLGSFSRFRCLTPILL